MKILILSNKLPFPLKDGGAIATFNMLKALATAGNQLTLLTFNTKKHFFPIDKFPDTEIPELKLYSVNINTQPKIFPALQNFLLSSKPYIAERFYCKHFIDALKKLLRKQQFDLIQIEGLYMLQYIPIIRANSKSLISYRAHNIEYEIWQQLSENKKNKLKRLYLDNLSRRIKKYELSIINQYDILIPISEKDALFFQKNGNKKPLFVSPVGFDTEQFKSYDKIVHKPKLYFLGSLDWLPNREGLLWFIDNCWNRLTEIYPEIELHIAGRNAPPDFATQIKHKNISFHGEVEDAHAFIKDKSIMIVPLLSGSGMRVKIIEAFFMQKAVVSTKLGAAGTESTDNKHLLIAENSDEFIQKISLLINHIDKYTEIVKNATKLTLHNFDNKQIAQKLNSFYKKLIY